MKRYKPKSKDSIEEIFKNASPVEPIDWEKIEKEKIEAYNKWWEEENNRFINIECPVCGSTEKQNVKKTQSNDIIGPGSRSWVTEEYIVCSKCGVMYKDLNKPENEPNHPSSRRIFY